MVPWRKGKDSMALEISNPRAPDALVRQTPALPCLTDGEIEAQREAIRTRSPGTDASSPSSFMFFLLQPLLLP